MDPPPPTQDPSATQHLVLVLEPDQRVHEEFLRRTLGYFLLQPRIAKVITPQDFWNIDGHADVLNHIDASFWQVMQPGLDALGFISCTGGLRGPLYLLAYEMLDARQQEPSQAPFASSHCRNVVLV